MHISHKNDLLSQIKVVKVFSINFDVWDMNFILPNITNITLLLSQNSKVFRKRFGMSTLVNAHCTANVMKFQKITITGASLDFQIVGASLK